MRSSGVFKQFRKMSDEAVHLSWNEFKTTAVKTFKSLQSDEDFTDMTLACGDGQQVLAHKVILSSCSPVFRNILTQNPHQHPLLYLKGVDIGNLKSIIKFVYSGEVEVERDHLQKFLEAANELKIEGLRKQTEKEEHFIETIKTSPKEDSTSLRLEKKIKEKINIHIKLPDNVDNNEDPFKETDLFGENQQDLEQTDLIMSAEFKCSNCPKMFSNRQKVSLHVKNVHQDNVKSCKLCAYKSNINLSRHMKKMHPDTGMSIDYPLEVKDNEEKEQISEFTCDQCMFEANSGILLMKHRKKVHPDADKYNCLVCNNQFASRTSLRVHQVIHSGVKFSCDECKHKSSSRSNLYRHIMKVHSNEPNVNDE